MQLQACTCQWFLVVSQAGGNPPFSFSDPIRYMIFPVLIAGALLTTCINRSLVFNPQFLNLPGQGIPAITEQNRRFVAFAMGKIQRRFD